MRPNNTKIYTMSQLHVQCSRRFIYLGQCSQRFIYLGQQKLNWRINTPVIIVKNYVTNSSALIFLTWVFKYL